MKNLLFAVGMICIVVWAMGLFGIGAGMALGNLIQILLVIAIVAKLYHIIARQSPKE